MSNYNYSNMSSNDVNALCFDYFNGGGAYQRQNMAFQSYLTQSISITTNYSNSSNYRGSNHQQTTSVYDRNGVFSSSRFM